MQDRNQALLGGILILAGLLFLVSTIFRVDFWEFCWPAALILIGVWIIARPRMVSSETDVRMSIFGDIDADMMEGSSKQEFWSAIGDVDLDLTTVAPPSGMFKINVYTFVGDIDLTVPETLPVKISASGFVTEGRIFGEKMGGFLTPIDYEAEGYAQAEDKIHVEVLSFVGDLKVRQV